MAAVLPCNGKAKEQEYKLLVTVLKKGKETGEEMKGVGSRMKLLSFVKNCETMSYVIGMLKLSAINEILFRVC